jgi:hypothetical protein
VKTFDILETGRILYLNHPFDAFSAYRLNRHALAVFKGE